MSISVDSVSGMSIKNNELPKMSIKNISQEERKTIAEWYSNFIGKRRMSKLKVGEAQRGIDLIFGMIGLFEESSANCVVERVLDPIDDLTLLVQNGTSKLLVNLSFGKRLKSTSRLVIVKDDKVREITFKDDSNIFVRRVLYSMKFLPSIGSKYLEVYRNTLGLEDEIINNGETLELSREEKVAVALEDLRKVRNFYVSEDIVTQEKNKEI